MKNLNAIALRRKNTVISGINEMPDIDPEQVKEFIEFLANYGYTISEKSIPSIKKLSLFDMSKIKVSISDIADKISESKVFHVNFPCHIDTMTNDELYIHAIMHYLTGMVPNDTKIPRPENIQEVKLRKIDINYMSTIYIILDELIFSNVSISEQDIEDMKYIINYVGILDNQILRLDGIPNRDNKVTLLYTILESSLSQSTKDRCIEKIKLDTATDVLKLAALMSKSDLSLVNVKFGKIKNSYRKFLLNALDNMKGNTLEDIQRYETEWEYLIKTIHPFVYKKRYKNARYILSLFVNGNKVKTFNSRVESMLENKDEKVIDLLSNRPGEFARRIYKLLELFDNYSVFEKFTPIISDTPTTTLLSLRNKANSTNDNNYRTIIPKNPRAYIQIIDGVGPNIETRSKIRISAMITGELIRRFKELPEWGKVFIDESIYNYTLPLGLRSSSSSDKLIGRGSKIKLSDSHKIIRPYIYWDHSADIDLSMVLLDSKFKTVDRCSFSRLQSYNMLHSGDITYGVGGASEYIDIEIDKVQERAITSDIRYGVIYVNVFSGPKFSKIDQCYAGVMFRDEARKGEIFDPKTVQHNFKIGFGGYNAVPFIIDFKERELIWFDMSMDKNIASHSSAVSNQDNLELTVKALMNHNFVDLGYVIKLHAIARGTTVIDREEADIVIAEDGDITPYDIGYITEELLK